MRPQNIGVANRIYESAALRDLICIDTAVFNRFCKLGRHFAGICRLSLTRLRLRKITRDRASRQENKKYDKQRIFEYSFENHV